MGEEKVKNGFNGKDFFPNLFGIPELFSLIAKQTRDDEAEKVEKAEIDLLEKAEKEFKVADLTSCIVLQFYC